MYVGQLQHAPPLIEWKGSGRSGNMLPNHDPAATLKSDHVTAIEHQRWTVFEAVSQDKQRQVDTPPFCFARSIAVLFVAVKAAVCVVCVVVLL